MTSVLTVDSLTVAIDGRKGTSIAVADVSLEIGRGEILGVVGESGAGKSMTGTAILGLLEHPLRLASGRIFLDGRRIDDLPEAEMRRLRGRAIGAVFQDPLTSLNPVMTIGRQLTQTIRTHMEMSEADARARALGLLQEVGIPAARERLDAYPHQLSGGMRQRVVLALAFACDPRLVIADEPTTALDVSVQAQVIELIKRLCREHGTAVMLVTHDMGVIAQTADRIAVMYAGRQVETGPARTVLKSPRHPYTRGLVAAIPSMRRRRDWLAQIDGAMPRPGALPAGCAFHPRCPDRMETCTSSRPELAAAGPHRTACWLDQPQATS